MKVTEVGINTFYGKLTEELKEKVQIVLWN